jgi:hypothetical protein
MPRILFRFWIVGVVLLGPIVFTAERFRQRVSSGCRVPDRFRILGLPGSVDLQRSPIFRSDILAEVKPGLAPQVGQKNAPCWTGASVRALTAAGRKVSPGDLRT